MTPSQYVYLYHNLFVADRLMDLFHMANIWMYVSGGNSVTSGESYKLLEAIGKMVKSKGMPPDIFYIKDNPKADPDEPFYKASIKRAYAGRGSPEDMRDTLRLAWLVKNCNGMSPAKYAEGWFGQDCNAFVGNYLGISPNHPIRAYANGQSEFSTESERVTASLLPLPLMERIDQIQTGTVIITYEDGGARPFRHIALVESFSKTGPEKAMIGITEWGEPSKSLSGHAKPPQEVKLKEGLQCKGLLSWKKKNVIGWHEKSGKHLRFFLDSSPLASLKPRGWHVGNREGV